MFLCDYISIVVSLSELDTTQTSVQIFVYVVQS